MSVVKGQVRGRVDSKHQIQADMTHVIHLDTVANTATPCCHPKILDTVRKMAAQ